MAIAHVLRVMPPRITSCSLPIPQCSTCSVPVTGRWNSRSGCAKATRQTRFEMIKLKRVYEKPARGDGLRILVERLWPRGVRKEYAKIDLWLKDLAPSTELRKWFGHDPAKWPEFQKRYGAELRQKKEAIDALRKKSKQATVTLVFSTKDELHSSALAIKRHLERR